MPLRHLHSQLSLPLKNLVLVVAVRAFAKSVNVMRTDVNVMLVAIALAMLPAVSLAVQIKRTDN